jgi:predicted alpha/beta superfamily hydrolase
MIRYRTLRGRLSFVALAVVITCPFAQVLPASTDNPGENAITVGKELSVESKILEEPRRIIVALPEDYETSDDRYPVVLLLGGHLASRLMLLRATVSILAEQGKMPDCIVVGIDTRAGYAKNLFPVKVDGWPDSGGADTFLRFIAAELIPFIDVRYRTAKYRVLVGQSNSGLTAVHALLANAAPIDGVIACSPGVGWCTDFVVSRVRAYGTEKQPGGGSLFVAYGSDDFPRVVVSGARVLETELGELSTRALRWRVDEIEGGGHVPVDCVLRGIRFVFPDWEATPELYDAEGLDGVRAHYKELCETYGFKVRVSTTLLDELGTRLMAAERWEDAIAVFELWIDEHPRSSRPYYFSAVVHYRTGNLEAAASLCRKAIELDEDFRHPRKLLSRIESEIDQ